MEANLFELDFFDDDFLSESEMLKRKKKVSQPP